MMTIPMDSDSDNSSRERVQRLYNKNVELENKRRKAAQARVPSDPSAWQQMRENYEAIILEDHAFSEQHEIEYALWQLHYRRIEELRAHFNAAVNSSGSTNSQNGRVPPRSGPDRITKIRTQFKTFLSEATGFYHDLMQKIRAKYGLPLGYFSDDPENQIASTKDGNKSVEVKKGLISCHRSLIYLGDLARYKGLYGEGDSKARDFAAASSYYLQASSLWPSSGNPHHQLAILASYSNDELVAIYRYFRSLAVESPFATARDNLIIAFEKNRQCYAQLLGDTKASTTKAVPSRTPGKGRGKGETRQQLKDDKVEANSVQEKASSMSDIFKTFSTRFVRLNGILFTRTSLETFGEVQLKVKTDLLELLSSGPDEKCNFGSDASDCRLAIVRLVAILIFTVHNVNRESENQSYADILQRSVLLQNAITAVFEFMGHVVERCVQLNDPTTSFLLPGVLVFVEWLACRQDVALGSEPEEKQTTARSFFWKNCIAFFNKLLSSGFKFVDDDKDECFFSMSRYDEGESGNRLALPEDFELRGFLPLLPAQLILDFSRKHSFGGDGGIKEKKARLQRIIAAGKALANVVRVGEEGIYFDSKAKKFAIGIEPQVSDDYVLHCSMEAPKLGGIELENPVAGQLTGAVQPNQQLYVEAEEEDEVIVFKPSVAEKHVNGSPSNTMTSEDPVSGVSAAMIPGVSVASLDLGNEMSPFSAALDGLIMQSALRASARPPTSIANNCGQYMQPIQPSIANNCGQYMQPIQPSTSMWSVEQASVMNGLPGLNLMGNGPTMNSELQHHSGVFPPAPYSVPFPQSVNFGMANSIPMQVPDAALPSNISSLAPSVAGIDSISIKSPPVMSTGIKKNPVSRPVRHLGPPPGFGSVPSKVLEESSSAMTVKNEHAPITSMDDYSWLDGYQLPSSHQSIGFNNSINHSTQSYHSVNKSSGSVGMVSFPFPGKQVTSLHVQSGTQKGWEDYQLSEQLNLYQEQPQQLQSGNQKSVTLPQQHQGQSLWEGRFFV